MKALLAMLLVASAALPVVGQTTVRDSLRNVSTKQHLAEGKTITVGFVAERGGSYLIRAVGPTLAQFGIETPLGNPRLMVISGSTKSTIVSNDDWGAQEADVSRAGVAVGAFPLAAQSRDSAIVVELVAGAYTIEVMASDAPFQLTKTGEVLVEVYKVNP